MGETKATVDVPLTEATADLMARIESANAKARVLGLITLCLITILITIGVIGIFKQNHLATQANAIAAESKQHIDCIIKDLSTPQAPGTTHKYIDYQSRLSADCKIKFN